MNYWEQAIDHLLECLPPQVSHWLFIYEERFHNRIFSTVGPRLKSCEPVNLDHASRSTIERLGSTNQNDQSVGLLQFLMHYGSFDADDPATALSVFTPWPPNRARICFDVADSNFSDLFSESPNEVRRRCLNLKRRLNQVTDLEYLTTAANSNALHIDCMGSQWTIYSGVEDFDYILPSGEVTCLPQSLNGDLVVAGWVIGTIPFGLKYGYIPAGALILSFENRRITSVKGNNRQLCADIEAALSRVSGLQLVNEVGIGQLKGVTSAAKKHKVGYHWHERHFGLHLGLGAELDESEAPGGIRATGHHLDIVFESGRLVNSHSVDVLRW